MDFIIGIGLVGIGFSIMKYRYDIYRITGEWSWATQYLGGNGTISAIVILGMFCIGVGVGYPFGVFPILNNNDKIPTISVKQETAKNK